MLRAADATLLDSCPKSTCVHAATAHMGFNPPLHLSIHSFINSVRLPHLSLICSPSTPSRPRHHAHTKQRVMCCRMRGARRWTPLAGRDAGLEFGAHSPPVLRSFLTFICPCACFVCVCVFFCLRSFVPSPSLLFSCSLCILYVMWCECLCCVCWLQHHRCHHHHIISIITPASHHHHH